MMKTKLKAALFLVAALAGWAVALNRSLDRASKIGPSTATAQVKISAVSGFRNCVSDLDVNSSLASTLVILAGGTTIYSVGIPAAGGIVRSWNDESAPCGAANQDVYINITAGTYNINYGGFTY